MNRNSGNVSKTKKLISGASNNSKPSRKLFQKVSESSSISSNRNSSTQSEDDARGGSVYTRPQGNKNESYEKQEHVVKKLQSRVKDLKHKVRVLEESVDSKDYSLGTIAREKDRAVGEVRRLERSNKQLRQQLLDERNHYLEEKEKFCQEMTRYKRKLQDLKTVSEGKKTNGKWNPAAPVSKTSLITQSLKWQFNKDKGDFSQHKMSSGELKSTEKPQKLSGVKESKLDSLGSLMCSDPNMRKAGSIESLHLYEGDDMSLQMAAIRTENAKLRSIICERDERNYELCLRFLRMKHYKNDIRMRFQDLENEYLQVISNLMEKIDEARQEFNFIIDKKFKKPLHSTNAMYLQLVQKNSRMAFENASLRLENQCLKKELNKYMNGLSDFERKVDQLSMDDKPAVKLNLKESKRLKKNVNFKEVQTIYERELAFKNSDTDSNYMSKTSTTVPSNVSIGDIKSNESVTDGRVPDNQDKGTPTFQANNFPEEILNKIFKRIDSSSCQSLVSNQVKYSTKTEIKTKSGKHDDRGRENNVEEIQVKHSSDKKKSKDFRIFGKQEAPNPDQIENISKVSDSSTPCDSKESFSLDVKDNKTPSEFLELSDRMGAMSTTEKESYQAMPDVVDKKKPERARTWKTRAKGSAGKIFELDDADDLLKTQHKKAQLFGRTRTERQDRLQQPGQEQQALSTRSRQRVKPFRDNCGLKEKFKFSDFELPPSIKVESVTQTPLDLGKASAKDLDKDRLSTKTEVRKSYDDVRSKHEQGDSLQAVLNKSSNVLSLHEDIIEATRSHLEALFPDEKFSKRERSVQSRPDTPQKTYRVSKDNSKMFASRHKMIQEPNIIKKDEYGKIQQDFASKPPRRQEGSKRFSHRLISTSPEQLKSILTDSQVEAYYRMAPVVVSQASTEVSPHGSFDETNNEIVLQLVIPSAGKTSEKKLKEKVSPIILEKSNLEKETSITGLIPVQQEESSNALTETNTSDIRIQVSNLPTSSSTMDVLDSAALNDKNNIMLRTLSAPGLLESNWLEPHKICEMRDSCTNT